jgi:hypothetical protein
VTCRTGRGGGGGDWGRGTWTRNRAGAVERRREGGGRNHGAGAVKRHRGGGRRNHGITRFEQGAAAIADLRSCAGSQGLARGGCGVCRASTGHAAAGAAAITGLRSVAGVWHGAGVGHAAAGAAAIAGLRLVAGYAGRAQDERRE